MEDNIIVSEFSQPFLNPGPKWKTAGVLIVSGNGLDLPDLDPVGATSRSVFPTSFQIYR